jgi:hypothetical protein
MKVFLAAVYLATPVWSAVQTVTAPRASETVARSTLAEPKVHAACASLSDELHTLRRELAEWRLEAQTERLKRLEMVLEQTRIQRSNLASETQAITQQIMALETQLQASASGSEQRLILDAEKAYLTGPNLERLRNAQVRLDRQDADLQLQLRAEQAQLDALQRHLQRLSSHP